MRSSKGGGGGAEKSSRKISNHILTLPQRLHGALNLGTRSDESNKRRWQCMDIEIQRHVIRSMSAFLESLSKNTWHHPLVKDSLGDMVAALVWILQFKNGVLASIAANVAVKLVNIVPNSLLKPYVSDLVYPLSCLLSSHRIEVVVSCAMALNLILLNLTAKNEKAVCKILEETEIIPHIVSYMKDFSDGMKPGEYIEQMLTLLSTILRRWPPSRFPVWNDAKLMKALDDVYIKPDFSIRAAVLKLYSAIALCGIGAKKLLEKGEAFLQSMVQCMGSSHPQPLRIEAFRLAQSLVINEWGCSEMMGLCCEPIVKAIICTMSEWSLHSITISNDQMTLLVEACRLAQITRWAGKHHICFWNHRIDKVFVDLLIKNFPIQPNQHALSLEEQIKISRKGLKENYLPGLRQYIWDILGWLATHCEENFYPDRHLGLSLDMLITCACSAFVDTISNWRQICQNDMHDAFKRESACRAVLMIIYSPCNYIALKARSVLSEMLKQNGSVHVKDLLHTLSFTSSGDLFGMSKIIIVANLMSLSCYLAFPQYRTWAIENAGITTLVALVEWCFNNGIQLERPSYCPQLYYNFHERTCCWVSREDWECKEVLLFYSLLGLAELIHHSGPLRDNRDIYSRVGACMKNELISKLKEICINASTPRVRWYASYILSYFCIYGFPSKLGRRIGETLNMEEYSDIRLIFMNGESLNVHGVLLAARCASLLPPEILRFVNKASCCSRRKEISDLSGDIRKEVRLSAHVDHQSLVKLLEYVYLGYLQTGEELVKKLKSLAKQCDLKPLLQILRRKRPKWWLSFPSSDLTLALGPAGYNFTDVILEAKSTDMKCWTCSICSLSVPHMHVHKVILWSSCDYLRALLKSGMKESHSNTIKVPISWEAMIKLVDWFYLDKLPNSPAGCLWDNMDLKEKFNELLPYIELCWLAEFWFLENVQDACLNVIVSCLDSSRFLSVKIICIAADFSLWKLAEVAADYMAPLYSQLRDSGELEELDETLLEMVRAASVRLSQEGGHRST